MSQMEGFCFKIILNIPLQILNKNDPTEKKCISSLVKIFIEVLFWSVVFFVSVPSKI